MKVHGAILLGALAVAAAACSKDKSGVTNPIGPKAGIRYFNAVPDTISLDFHAVDIVENSDFIHTQFRELKRSYYMAIDPGSRHYKVFPDTILLNVTSSALVDTTLNFTANTNYTIVHAGFSRTSLSPRQRLYVFTDTTPTVPAGQVAVRVINAGTSGNFDVYNCASTTCTLPATAALSNVAPLSPTKYIFLPTAATTAFRITAPGSTTPVASAVLPAGDVGGTQIDPIPGSSIAGSVFTLIIYPPSVAGSPAAASTTPTIGVAADVQLHNRPSS